MGRLLTTFKDKTFEPSMKSYFKLYTDDTTTASQIYDSLLYVRGTNAGSLVKNQENDDDVSTVETYDTYMPVRFHNIKSASDGTTPAGPTHTFYSVYNRAEYNGPSGQNMYDLYADYNIAKLSGAGYITNSIGGAYNYGYDAGSGDDQTIPGVYGVINYARVQPTGSNRTVSYNIGARNWVDINKSDLTATYVYPTISEFAHRTGTVGTLAMHKFDLDYTEGNITNAYFIWADESTLPTPSGEKYFIKSNIPWPTLLSGALTNTGAVTFNSTLSVSGTATLSSNVNIGGNLVVTGTSTFNGGTITIGDAASDNVVFGADVDSHIIPDDDDTYDLGSNSQQWRNLYVDGTAYIDVLSLSNNFDLPDNVAVRWGNSQDLRIVHDGTDSFINSNGSGDLYVQQFNDDKDIIFKSDDGSGGVAEYFKLDGSAERNIFSKDSEHSDNVSAYFGSSNDFRIHHNGSHTFLAQSGTGDLRIVQNIDDGDILLQSDDGSGGTATYMTIDGGVTMTTFAKSTRHNDGVYGYFGDATDLGIVHNGTDSYIINETGDLYIRNKSDNKRIRFQSDDGSGDVATYFQLDGNQSTSSYLYTNFPDNSILSLGNGFDTQIYHTGTNTIFYNQGGNLEFQQATDDADMIFKCDDGSGGITEYFKLDGSLATHDGSSTTALSTVWGDNSKVVVGDGADGRYWHDGTNTYLQNTTGDLIIQNFADNKDIIFKSDDGSGGTDTYMTIDGSAEKILMHKSTVFSGGGMDYGVDGTGADVIFYGDTSGRDMKWDQSEDHLLFKDNTKLKLGTSGDLEIYHDGTDSYLENDTGHLYIRNNSDDKDIIFQSDDQSGGLTTYFHIDGGDGRIKIPDSTTLQLGDGGDLQFQHDATDSLIRNYTGDLKITNFADDKDIKFLCDNGSGGETEYFRVDGSATNMRFYKNTRFDDDVQVQIGSGADLQIVHNGTDTQINNLTGNLQFTQLANDKDISFASDDGSGGDTIYMYLDGSTTDVRFNKSIRVEDNEKVKLGSGEDLQIFHDATDSHINNINGHLYIENFSDDKDIYFQTDDGSGGTTTYFMCDGSLASSGFTTTKWGDQMQIALGDDRDLRLWHQSGNNFITAYTGDFYLKNENDDGDIIFQNDNGSGGLSNYIVLDGGDVSTKIETIKVLMPNLPTSDPSVAGQLWNSSGDLKISAG